ncbi:MAG: hypothetical protein LBN21_08960, partial [Treponema sp.]|nr:hypothetical protein [Treponema sp.]
MKKITVVLCFGFLILQGAFAASPEGFMENTTRRFGIFIGSNNGGRGRVMLRYAVSDARAIAKVFSDMGGIGVEDNILLVEPALRDINRQIQIISDRVENAKQNYKRTEL